MTVTIDGSASVTINSGAILGITSGTAVASTSGTSIDFTSIPSWVKRLTVLFSGVSTTGSALLLVQLGVSTPVTSGYVGATQAVAATSSTAGFIIYAEAAQSYTGIMTINAFGSNLWVQSNTGTYTAPQGVYGAGRVTLSGTLDRIRITTVNGTDTFDLGSVNIMYEG